MKQKELTDIQKSLLENLESVLKEAARLNIRFFYDCGDCTVSAFNGENVEDCYSGSKENEEDESMDWDIAHPLFEFKMDYFDSRFDNLNLHFK